MIGADFKGLKIIVYFLFIYYELKYIISTNVLVM